MEVAGSGVGGFKAADHVHAGCERLFMGLPLAWADRRRQWGEMFDYCRQHAGELEVGGILRGWVLAMQGIWRDMEALRHTAAPQEVKA
ncbi:MAG: hypothetical protein ACYDHZ_00845 [Dehalococcoidia bacterium]